MIHGQQCNTARRPPFAFPEPLSYHWLDSRTVRYISTDKDPESCERRSVTGLIYGAVEDSDRREQSKSLPVVQLYTKYGCTLCDNVAAVLRSVRETHPHILEAVDITDEDKSDWFSKYKWDIPILHIDGKYWTKHRMTPEEAVEGLKAATADNFQEQPGEPDAGELERRQAERQKEEQ